MSRLKFEEFYAIFQDRVNKCLKAPELHKYKYQDGISCLCISHDNSNVFMGAIDGSLGSFNLSSKEPAVLYKLSEAEAEITAVTVTKDDKYIIFAASNGSIGVFDWCAKQIRHMFQNVHKDAISSLALTKDYEYIVSGCRDGSIGLFDMGMEMRTAIIQEAHEDVINSIKLCCNDRYIVSASDDKSIRIFDFDKKQLLHVIEQAHQSGVTSLVITNDAKYILSASNDSDRSLKIFDFRTRQLVHSFSDHDSSSITALTVTDDDKYIISGCLDRSIRIYDLQKRHVLHSFEDVHEDPITTLAITKSKHFIVSACYDGSLHILDLESKDLVHSYKPHEGKVTSLVATNDNRRIISASRDCGIDMFNIKTQETVWKKPNAHKAAITGLALTSDDEILVSVSRDKCIKFFNINVFEEIHAIRDAHEDPITSVAITSNNKLIVTSAEDLTIKIFDFADKCCLYTFQNAQGYPGSSIAISKDNKHIISASLDRSLYIFDIEKRTRFVSHENKGTLTSLLMSLEIPLSLSCDNHTVLFQLDQSSIGVYNLERREMFGKLENCIDGTLTTLAITYKYDYIIAGSTKGDISILDLTDGKRVYMIENAHKTKITNILLVENDKFIVSSDVEGTINIFTNPLSTNEILTLDTSINTKVSIFDLMILNRFIFDESFPAKIEIMKKYPDLQIYPYRWNFFHLISKFYSRRDLIMSGIQFQLPLLIDSYNHTPLHYLLNKREIDFGLINGLFENYSDIILKHSNRDRIVQSLTSDLPSMLRMNTSEVAYFLRIGVGKPLTYGNEDIPHFGKLRNNVDCKFLVSKYQTFSPEVRSELLQPDVEAVEDDSKVDIKPVISISVLKFYLNYQPYSKDMLQLIQALKKVTNEDIFKSQAASILIQYLWTENRIIHYVLTFIFSVLMVILSVYSANSADGGRNLTLEIIILSLSVLYFSYEMFQLHFTPFKIYLTQIWNVFNVIFTAILSVTIILQWIEIPIFTKNVLMSVSLFFGYLKWISFFRVIDQTRKLIRVILEIIMAMRSFILILILLVFGFSLIFIQFDRESTYGENLLTIYTMIYAQSDPSEFSTAQVCYYVIFTILLAVILLNMLVAIMTDTYDKSLDKSVLAEGREKVSLILEATVLMRSFKRIFKSRQKIHKKLKEAKNRLEKQLIRHTDTLFEKQALQENNYAEKSAKKGFLFFVRKVEKDFDYSSNLFDLNQGVKKTRSILGASSALVDEDDLSEFAILRGQNNQLRAIVENQDLKIKELERVIKTGFDNLEKKFKVKMEEILTTVIEDSFGQGSSDLQAKYLAKRTSTKKLSQKEVNG